MQFIRNVSDFTYKLAEIFGSKYPKPESRNAKAHFISDFGFFAARNPKISGTNNPKRKIRLQFIRNSGANYPKSKWLRLQNIRNRIGCKNPKWSQISKGILGVKYPNLGYKNSETISFTIFLILRKHRAWIGLQNLQNKTWPLVKAKWSRMKVSCVWYGPWCVYTKGTFKWIFSNKSFQIFSTAFKGSCHKD